MCADMNVSACVYLLLLTCVCVSAVLAGSREPSVHHEHTASDVSTDSVNQQ